MKRRHYLVTQFMKEDHVFIIEKYYLIFIISSQNMTNIQRQKGNSKVLTMMMSEKKLEESGERGHISHLSPALFTT